MTELNLSEIKLMIKYENEIRNSGRINVQKQKIWKAQN